MAIRVAAVAAVLGIVSAAAASSVPTFTRPQSYATKKDPRSVAIGDLNGDGLVDVRLAPSNCVQCGAITAKGGRLTPPEGGSGPEYTLT